MKKYYKQHYVGIQQSGCEFRNEMQNKAPGWSLKILEYKETKWKIKKTMYRLPVFSLLIFKELFFETNCFYGEQQVEICRSPELSEEVGSFH